MSCIFDYIISIQFGAREMMCETSQTNIERWKSFQDVAVFNKDLEIIVCVITTNSHRKL